MATVAWSGGPTKQQQKDLDTKGYCTGGTEPWTFKIACGCGGVISIYNIGIYRYEPKVMWGGVGECHKCNTDFRIQAPTMEELPNVLLRIMGKPVEAQPTGGR